MVTLTEAASFLEDDVDLAIAQGRAFSAAAQRLIGLRWIGRVYERQDGTICARIERKSWSLTDVEVHEILAVATAEEVPAAMQLANLGASTRRVH